MTPSIVPPVLSIPACNLLSQPSGKDWIQEIIELSSEHDLKELQPSQRPTTGPSEQAAPRRSERICLQHKKNLSSGPVTRYQARRDTGDYSNTLVYEINEDNYPEHSGINPSQEFSYNYLTISASAELVEENNIDSVFSTQDLIIPADIKEGLQDPIWKQSMDEEYGALINKKVWDVVLPPPDTNIVGSCWTHICKCNWEGTERTKLWVVAKGFTQTSRVDYNETYAPVSQLASLQTICTIMACNDWPIH